LDERVENSRAKQYRLSLPPGDITIDQVMTERHFSGSRPILAPLATLPGAYWLAASEQGQPGGPAQLRPVSDVSTRDIDTWLLTIDEIYEQC
jgi:hypothetical protein